MKTKPLKVDWDALEEAFSSQREEAVYYLDLVDGRVALEGEDSEDEDMDEDGNPRAVIPTNPNRNDAMRLMIRPPSVERKIGWLKDFLPTIEGEEPDMTAKIREAIELEDPGAAIGKALNEHPEGRTAWYLYRAEQVEKMVEDWLKEHEVQYVDAPPWRE